jgi:ankyrin repeat protein
MDERFATLIEKGETKKIETWLSLDVVDVNVRLPRDFSPPALVHAALNNRKEIVEILLRANARVNETDDSGQTACDVAASLGHHDVLVLLLEAGARFNLNDGSDWCSFAASSTFAIQALLDRGVAVRDLRGHDDRGTALHVAARSLRDATVFRMLVDVCGVDLEARDCPGRTCVHAAVDHHNDFALRWLFEAGADMNCLSDDGLTPLHRAINCALSLFRTLVSDCCVDLEARDGDGRTCLQYSVDNRNRVALRWLIEAGADVNCVSSDGSTTLHFTDDCECAIMLLASGADVCARGGYDGRLRAVCRAFDCDCAVLEAQRAGGAYLDSSDEDSNTARQEVERIRLAVDQVAVARRDIAKARLDFVRYRALEVCIGLQSLRINALQMCEIMQSACCPRCAVGPVSHVVDDCDHCEAFQI